MASRTGIPTVIKVARQLCRALVLFDPLIRKAVDNNPAVIAALEAALAACSVLEQTLRPYLEPGD